MKERWQQLAARFDALAQRERLLVLVAALVGFILVFDTLALDPLMARKKRLTQQLAEARQSAGTVENQLKAQKAAADPEVVRLSYRDALRWQLADIDQNMGGLQRGLVPPERMAKLLEEVLTRSRGLLLVSLRTLPVQRFDAPGLASAAKVDDKGAKPAAKEPRRAVYQHGYEIVLQGTYAELHYYLTGLEQLPWQMFWGHRGVSEAQGVADGAELEPQQGVANRMKQSRVTSHESRVSTRESWVFDSRLATRDPRPSRPAIWLVIALMFISANASAQAMNDPTRPPGAYVTGDPDAGDAPRGGPVLQSVMISRDRKAAIINGEMVRLGEKYGDAVLVKVAESEVVLKSGDATQVLKLYPGVEKRAIVPAAAKSAPRRGKAPRGGAEPPATGSPPTR
jgi:MSHA biogenesis protein MshJ